MTALIVVLVLVSALALALGARLFYVQSQHTEREQHWLEKVDDAEVLHADLHAEMLSIAMAPWSRYEVMLADWGPDFTGEGDILPRWRWSVVDADRAIKAGLGLPVEVGSEEVPFILGNEVSAEMALIAAFEWVEEREHPMLSVVVGEVTPWRAGA